MQHCASMFPQMHPFPFSQTACRCYPSFPKAKCVSTNMSGCSFAPLTFLLVFFHGRSYIISSFFQAVVSFHSSSASLSYLLPHLLLRTLVQHYMVFILFLLCVLACLSVWVSIQYTPLSLLHPPVFPVVKIDAQSCSEFLSDSMCEAGHFRPLLEKYGI